MELITKAPLLKFVVSRTEQILTKIPDRHYAQELELDVARAVDNDKRSTFSRILSVLWVGIKAIPSIIIGLSTMNGKQIAASLASILAGILTSVFHWAPDWVIPGTEFTLEWLITTALIALGTWLLPGLFRAKLNPETEGK